MRTLGHYLGGAAVVQGVVGDGMHDRGQASVIGTALMIGLVIAGATLTVALGGVALTDLQDSTEAQQSELALTQFDSAVSTVALGRSDVRQVTMGGRGTASETATVQPNAGQLTVTFINASTGARCDVVDTSLGSVVTESGDSEVAYQSGGVWRRSGDDSRMVSPPEFHYRGRTLTLPVIAVNGNGAGETMTVREQGSTTYGPCPDGENPLTNGRVVVTIESRYYDAWGSYFEQRTHGNVDYDHTAETTTVELVVPLETPPVAAGFVADSDVTVSGNTDMDGYDSSAGPYGVSSGDGNLIVRGDLTVDGNNDIQGDVVVGGGVDFEHQDADVTGDLTYGDDIDPADSRSPSDHVGGTISDGAEVRTRTSVGGLINEKEAAYRQSNDNNGAPIDSGDELTGCASTCELDPGRYYLTQISLSSSDTLKLDASNGDIEIYVENGVDITGSATIELTSGDGTVRIYNDGNYDMNENSEVVVPGDRSPRYWVYMQPGKQVDFSENAVFRGVIYGPNDGENDAVDVQMQSNVEVYGGIVGNTDELDNNAAIHYDEALADEQPVPADESIPHVSYLHVTVNEVEVD